jgi:hypothetical protein
MSAPPSDEPLDPRTRRAGARLRALFEAALKQPPERRAAWLREQVADE